MADSRFAQGYLFAALTVAIWSGFALVSRIGGTSVLTGLDITALRFGTAAVLLLPALSMRGGVGLPAGRLAALALFGGLGYSLLVYSGFAYAPAVHGAILLSGLLPFEVAAFAWLLLDERPSARRWLGLGIIAAGVACLGTDVLRGDAETWRGDLLILGASLCWALYTVLARRWTVAPWDATIGVALLAALVYLPIYVFFLPKQLAAAPWSLIAGQAVYQGIIVVIVAMILYMKAAERMGPTRLGTFMALVPAISGLAAVPLLGEPLTGWLLGGLALVSGGAYLGSRS